MQPTDLSSLDSAEPIALTHQHVERGFEDDVVVSDDTAEEPQLHSEIQLTLGKLSTVSAVIEASTSNSGERPAGFEHPIPVLATSQHVPVPVVQITADSPPPPPQPNSRSYSNSHLQTGPASTPSSLQNSRLRSQSTDPIADRRSSRRRSGMDPSTPSRLTGFLSNLLHIRDREPITSNNSSSRPSSSPPSPAPPSSRLSAVSSAAAPSLPAPSLAELGLSLSAVTTELTSPQFTPPQSGTFLAPNYLLLCHSQGLDVVPLMSPPTPQPYSLVRRVAFKSVVVMEERGVLVAIAGRRDGVRVYALEDVRKAIEWRIEVEMRKVLDRVRKGESKRPFDISGEGKGKFKAKATATSTSNHPAALSQPSPKVTITIAPEEPVPTPRPRLHPRTSIANLRIHAYARSRAVSLTRRQLLHGQPANKDDWHEDNASDDEALVAAGPSGSAALEERTSPSAAAAAAALNASAVINSDPILSNPHRPSVNRRRRPSHLDLTAVRDPNISRAIPSPAPTLLTLRQALLQEPAVAVVDDEPSTPNGEVISFAEALLESRLPTAGPLGTTRPNVPTLIADVAAGRAPVRRSSELSLPRQSLDASIPPLPQRGGGSVRAGGDRRRRWSVLDGILHPGGASEARSLPASPTPELTSSISSTPSHCRSSSHRSTPPTPSHHVQERSSSPRNTPHSRFLPRLLASLQTRRSEDGHSQTSHSVQSKPGTRHSDVEKSRIPVPSAVPPAPAPKLEYVKLPGTKGAIMVKAVETAKKSFLAILCGEGGEKVELFAGTYRTALGLSRTFILPDSPRSLELQLQGDDLVEVFLVFSQNVFGLEPATVRVREVRIGRAERRAARRRARERTNDDVELLPPPDDDLVIVTPSMLPPEDRPSINPDDTLPLPRPSPTVGGVEDSSLAGTSTPPAAQAEELAALAAARMGPYTTFQQLGFAPPFPLASLADECIIPPTYTSFVSYRTEHEPDESLHVVPTSDSTPPATPVLEVKWCYRDPKGIVQGPWKSSTMHTWFKDGYLPTDLPLRRETETEYILLKDLMSQSPDPLQPFLDPTPSSNPAPPVSSYLLPPISLLQQPKHFGPPALFFSSRGGHSTSIVDHRGRSVLKGRLNWSPDTDTPTHPYLSLSHGRMGDVTRVEAFDVKNKAVIVALRQGGLEALDVGDALLSPADESRTVFPNFHPPAGTVGRRPPFAWRIGTPFSLPQSASVASLHNTSMTSKKKSTSMPRLHGRVDPNSPTVDDPEFHIQDELLFLGRNDDNLYCCERGAGSFRILVLSTL